MQWLKTYRLGKEIQYLTSLIAGGHVVAKQGDSWAANYEERVIYWRLTNPNRPGIPLTESQVIFNVGHEAGHLLYTGGYDVPELTTQHVARFHRFVNWVEDIRIERLVGREYPGFERMRNRDNLETLQILADTRPEQWHAVDQLGASWMSIENGGKPLCDSHLTGLATRCWAAIDRIANTASTQDVATAIWPIYRQIMDRGQPDEQVLSSVAAQGSDQPSDSPRQEPMKVGQEPLTRDKLLSGIISDARNGAKLELTEELRKELNEKHLAKRDAANSGDGASSPTVQPGAWVSIANDHKLDIATLTHRLRAALITNAADNWQTGYRRGRLDTRRAPKAEMGRTDIMRRKTAVGTFRYLIGVSLDCSSSMLAYETSDDGKMGPSRFDNGYRSIVTVAEALERLNGVDSFVVMWSEKLWAAKPAGAPLSAFREDLSFVHPHGGTKEVVSVNYAIKQFEKYPRIPSALITITDGEDNSPAPTHEMLPILRDTGARLIDIGIQHTPKSKGADAVIVINDPSDLHLELPKIVASLIHKGS